MSLKKIYGVMVLLLCLMLSGCDNPDAVNEEGVETKYRESLLNGTHICPPFPETKGLAYVDEQFLLDSICPAIVRLENGDLFASGVIWKMDEDYIWIITNQHVLDWTADSALTEVIFSDGIRAYCEITGVSDEYDLGFVKVSLADMGYYTLDRYLQIRYDTDIYNSLIPGDDIFIVGSADYPAGNLYYGTIGNKSIYMDIFNTEMLWAYCEVKEGMSGSGVFDRYGNLIGIVCAGNDQKEAAVLTIDKILDEWGNG